MTLSRTCWASLALTVLSWKRERKIVKGRPYSLPQSLLVLRYFNGSGTHCLLDSRMESANVFCQRPVSTFGFSVHLASYHKSSPRQYVNEHEASCSLQIKLHLQKQAIGWTGSALVHWPLLYLRGLALGFQRHRQRYARKF